jgi:hypothetical protein
MHRERYLEDSERFPSGAEIFFPAKPQISCFSSIAATFVGNQIVFTFRRRHIFLKNLTAFAALFEKIK